MDKLKLHTPDLTVANIDRISELFPNCVTEAKDEKGRIKRAIDFDLLRQELSPDLVEGPQERYRLDWPGKREALALANTPVALTLRPCREESVDFENTKNLYIEGDNLDALKLLQETYLGKVKMIYIDPPYNTGNDFIYDDNFSMARGDYEERSGDRDQEGNAMFDAEKWKQNSTANGRFHSEWLSMMYSRLKLARDFLSETGIIFISIDDWEVGNLRIVTDEVFGRSNFVGLFCRKTKSGGGSASGACAVEHDYVLAYARNQDEAAPLQVAFNDSYLLRYKESDDFGPYFWDTMERSSTKTKPYPIHAPDGTILTGKWFRSEATFKEDLARGEVRFLKKPEGWSVQFKQRLAEGKKLRTILETADLTSKEYRSLSAELDEIVSCTLEHPPKPLTLMKTLVSSVTGPEGNDIVLDFFSGSATTAHAVMQLNAEDGGKRRHIMVQLPEPCDEKSEAFKAGYKTIAEIGKERIRRAGKKILQEWQAKHGASPDQLKLNTENPDASPPDIGFRVLKVADSNFRDIARTPDELEQQELALHTDHLKPDRTPEDLLFQVLVDWGVDLALPIVAETLHGKRVFFVDQNALAACFDSGLTDELVRTIAERKPLRVVFRDDGFGDDSTRINVEQIFKLLSPGTEVKAL